VTLQFFALDFYVGETISFAAHGVLRLFFSVALSFFSLKWHFF